MMTLRFHPLSKQAPTFSVSVKTPIDFTGYLAPVSEFGISGILLLKVEITFSFMIDFLFSTLAVLCNFPWVNMQVV